MDQTTCLIAKQDVDLLRFDNSCYLAAAKLVMRHRLALAILLVSIIRTGGLAFAANRKRSPQTFIAATVVFL